MTITPTNEMTFLYTDQATIVQEPRTAIPSLALAPTVSWLAPGTTREVEGGWGARRGNGDSEGQGRRVGGGEYSIQHSDVEGEESGE